MMRLQGNIHIFGIEENLWKIYNHRYNALNLKADNLYSEKVILKENIKLA